MSQSFSEYADAARAARIKATSLKMDIGLEAANEFGRKVYRIFLLPRPDQRQGHELSCEVIRPGEPL